MSHLAVSARVQFGGAAFCRIQARYSIEFARDDVRSGVLGLPIGECLRIGLDLVHRRHFVGESGLVFHDRCAHFAQGWILGEPGFHILVENVVFGVGHDRFADAMEGVVGGLDHGCEGGLRLRVQEGFALCLELEDVMDAC